jgi:hypothetical protein
MLYIIKCPIDIKKDLEDDPEESLDPKGLLEDL